MKFSKESLKYTNAIKELSEFEFDGTVYLVDTPAFIYEFYKKSFGQLMHGAGYYKIAHVLTSYKEYMPYSFKVAKQELGIIFIYVMTYSIENSISENFLKKLEKETIYQYYDNDHKVFRHYIPSLQ